MKKLAGTMITLLILLVAFCGWFAVASNYEESVAVGEYRFAGGGVNSTLTLKPDLTFQQDLTDGKIARHAMGTWRREGMGGISFSKEFIPVPGDEPEPDGTTFSEMHKPLGLFLSSLRLRQYHVLWYGRTGTGDSISASYIGDQEGVAARLILIDDHSFTQTVTVGGAAKHATGTWHQAPNGDISFSQAFLKTSGEALTPNETATAMNPRGSNLQIEIAISSPTKEASFEKRFNWR